MPECPAPDCDYANPSKEAVKGHWGGSQDAQHTGKYHQAREAYDEAQEQSDATTAEAQQVTSAAPPSGGGGEPSSDTSPTVQQLDLPTTDTTGTDDDIAATDTELSCPVCGGQRGQKVGDLVARLERANSDQAGTILTYYDWDAVPDDAWVCGPCWEGGEVTVYSDQ